MIRLTLWSAALVLSSFIITWLSVQWEMPFSLVLLSFVVLFLVFYSPLQYALHHLHREDHDND